MKANFRNFALGALVVLLLLALFTLFQNPGQRTADNEISFSQFLAEVDQGRVRDVLIQDSQIYGTLTDGRSFQTYAPIESALIQRLYGKGVSITARPLTLPWWLQLAISWLAFIELIGVCLGIFFMLRVLLRIQRALDNLSERGKDKG
jgi:cell division protease FtsH